MKPLPEGKSPVQPDWLNPVRCVTKYFKHDSIKTVKDGQYFWFEYDVVKKDDPIFQPTKESSRQRILNRFKAGKRIQRYLRDIAWDVF